MIVVDQNRLSQIGQEYLARLKRYAANYPRRAVGKIVKALTSDELQSLILCPPENLMSMPAPKKVPKRLFLTAYRTYFRSGGYMNDNNALWLVKRLNITVCPYCNRAYTFSVEKKPATAKRNVRPELDHFFPKSNSAYMHLAISFYNLVPSCPLCNQLKGENVFDFHPYYGSLNGKPAPKVVVSNAYKKADGITLFPEKPLLKLLNANKNTETLALAELYEQHNDYAKEILDKIQAYNMDALIPLVETYHGMGKTVEEIDRLVWGVYIETGLLGRRPLSKLTRDLLEQFGVI